jgi:hypothetical protein
MALAEYGEVVPAARSERAVRGLESTTLVPTLAALSLAAGLLNAAVVSAHRGHGVAATVLIGIAIFQVTWAVLALAWPTRLMLSLGALANAVIVGGYLVSRTTGIPGVNGFKDVESIAFTDAVTTAFQVLLVVGIAYVLFAGSALPSWPSGRAGATGFGAVGLAVALVGVPAAVAAPAHHDHGQTLVAAGGHSHAGATANAAVHQHGAPSNTGPVTPEQRAAADKLLADNKALLPQWADSAKAEAAGFRTIGDGVTGNEHLINWNWINDSTVLDPNHPESLVYRPTPTGRVLEAAMYIVPVGTADKDLPDIGGTLTQWHIHNNLCFSPERITNGSPQRNVIGITGGDGSCARGDKLPTAQMLHVWIVPNRCGPFSALEGIGGGQKVQEAEDPAADPNCQHSH